ncbi:MAG TPA: AIR synthase related protein, partial [Candidatus Binataceae bacterium]|nr:AIR synthase related protein [Candidatus Binataceae bacterium]
KIFQKWDLHAVVIGHVTGDKRWRARWRGQVVADIPASALADNAPVYDRPAQRPASREARVLAPAGETPAPREALRALLDSPNVASKRWVFQQYDSIVQGNTVAGPGSDAAVLRLKQSRRGLALKVDSNPRACQLDPYLGAVATVVECARNVACAGARPVGITNCLNYGNPERPEVMWQFTEGLRGLADASRAFDAPVVSGNVSFYNETEGRAILPTPTIAVLGVMVDVACHMTSHFKSAGDAILLARTAPPSLAASEYESLYGSPPGTALAPIELTREAALLEALVAGAERGLIKSAHDVAEGGLAVAIVEACMSPRATWGAEIESGAVANAVEVFAEGPSTVVLSATHENVDGVAELFRRSGIVCRRIGTVTAAARLVMKPHFDEDLLKLRGVYEQALPRRLA